MKIRFNSQCVNAAMDDTTDAMGAYITLKALLLHVVGTISTSENFTVTLDSHLGSDYDTVLVSQDLAGVNDYVLTGDDLDVPMHPDDKLKFAYTNTDKKTVSVQVILE